MQFHLFCGGLRAVVDTFGGELVSLKDPSGTEYIWGGDPAYWSGRNPVLFPIIGKLKQDAVRFKAAPYKMAKHGLARKSEFTVVEQAADYVVLELRESEASLTHYPFPFSLQVRHQLTERGFSTVLRVENPGTDPMPFCIGSHTAFRCPLYGGTRFEDYEVVFDQPEDCSTILVTEQGLLSHTKREPLLSGQDRIALDYPTFARLDTLVLEGLHSTGVSLLHQQTGHGVHMDFAGFPMLGIWTMGQKQAPFLCLEAWHGCPAYDNDSGVFEEKPYCIVLQPNQVKELKYTVSLR